MTKELKNKLIKIDEFLSSKNCYMNWDLNDDGHLFYIVDETTNKRIEKQFDGKQKNMTKKLNQFIDFVQETYNKKII